MVRFVCPLCGTPRELDARWIGHQTVCLACRKPVTVRVETDTTAPVVRTRRRSPQAEPRPEAAPQARPLPVTERKLRVHCPACGRLYAFHDDCVGVAVHCFRCDARFTILSANGEVMEGELADTADGDGDARSPVARFRQALDMPLGRIPGALSERLRRGTRCAEQGSTTDAEAESDPADAESEADRAE